MLSKDEEFTEGHEANKIMPANAAELRAELKRNIADLSEHYPATPFWGTYELDFVATPQRSCRENMARSHRCRKERVHDCEPIYSILSKNTSYPLRKPSTLGYRHLERRGTYM